MNCFYSKEELKTLLKGVGDHVKIHRTVQFFNPKSIVIGSHVRIDCFALLSAGTEGIEIGNWIHIGAATHFFGGGGRISMGDFANVSSRVSLFTISDDYKDGYLTNPMVADKYRKLDKGAIDVQKHAIIGCGTVILPGVRLEIGASVGALSLVKETVPPFQIFAGTPAKRIGERSRDCLMREREFLQEAAAWLPEGSA